MARMLAEKLATAVDALADVVVDNQIVVSPQVIATANGAYAEMNAMDAARARGGTLPVRARGS